MAHQNNSPPTSPTSTPASQGTHTPLSLDLSSVPPLITPSPPSNTLLITNLLEPSIFHPTSISQIRTLLSEQVPLHSFSPLKSFRRIVVSFYTIDDAISIRQLLDDAPIMSSRARIYFGELTPIEPIDQHLHAPESKRTFFISPPPSPPHGWEMRNEDPPNKEVHAEDLATALANLRARPPAVAAEPVTTSPAVEEGGEAMDAEVLGRQRRGSSTVVFQPGSEGESPGLPAVMVEDTTGSEDMSPVDGGTILAHTSRPPVELMHQG